MTRKCVLCKETNYRNTYSFFSAPKDPETRKKWQNAIAIENYAVTDDTYVCSKHFHKDDIITHWVSGVPPHVITIKYKKCRLRPGAVPGRNYHLEENAHTQHSDDSDCRVDNSSPHEKISVAEKKETDFLIPRTEEKLKISNDENHVTTLFSHDFSDYSYNSKKNLLDKIELSESDMHLSNISHNGSKVKDSPKQNLNKNSMENNRFELIVMRNPMENINSKDRKEKQNQIPKEDSYSDVFKKISKLSSKSYISEEDEAVLWKHKTEKKDTSSKQNSKDNFKAIENVYIENQIVNNLNYNELNTYYSTYNEIDENEMLFEDLLEVCTEVLLPRGWSCLVTSKGHTTTIVYLYMGITKTGMPFTEKQVFIKSDMMLHCAAVNREIDPLIHNLIREGKHLRVQNLIDIEELIDEFDQRTVCLGIYNHEGFRDINHIKIAYKDGIKWRHVLCPLIVNNDSSRCTKCISLSSTLQRESNSLMFPQNPSIFAKQKEQKIYSVRQKYKRTKRQDHGYEFIKIFKQ